MLHLRYKMHFGKAEHNGTVNYTLPADHRGLQKVLGGIRTSQPQVYTGGVLWAEEKFRGLIYPEKARPSDFVKYYVRQFNTIELNATHYRIPGAETFSRWKELAPEGFKFCPKIHKSISHSDDLRSMIGFHNECAALFECLGTALGPCFMQLPPYFSPHRLPELLEFLENSELQNLAIELRHEDWFKEGRNELNSLCNYLYKNKMSLVITDTPGRRDVVHMRLTSVKVLVRFKAVNDAAIDKQRIDDWITRMAHWFDKGLEEFYFFVHTADKSDMPYLVAYFTGKLEEVCGIALKPPIISPGKGKQSLF